MDKKLDTPSTLKINFFYFILGKEPYTIAD